MTADPETRTGFCECGCGQPAPIADQSHKRRGYIKGQPKRFVHGHARRPRKLLEERALALIADRPSDGCWKWGGRINDQGYGIFYVRTGVPRKAHRIVYEILVGPIPEFLVLDHLCENKACVNPDHFEPVPDSVNILRGSSPSALNARKTHCKRGHELTPENVLRTPDGRRRCRECCRMFDRKYYWRDKAA